jgi:hypothetical protein
MIWTQKLITTTKGQGHRCRWKRLKIEEENKQQQKSILYTFFLLFFPVGMNFVLLQLC